MTTLPFPIRNCPICGSGEKRVIFQQRFGTFSEGSLLSGYDVATCAACGFVYADGIPDQAAFDRHYAEMSKYEYAHSGGEVSPLDTRRFGEIAGLIERNLPDRSLRVLDVGCATGGLLAEMRSRGYANVSGLDPSPACGRFAREFYGIQVHEGTIFKNGLAGGAFDLIILVGVLEHVRDLLPALQGIGASLTEDGCIYAEVPDLSAFMDWPGAPYQEFSTEHIGFFGPKSLHHLFHRSGYRLLNMERVPRQFTKSTVMPSACGLFRRGVAAAGELPVDDETEPALLRYLERSAREERRVVDILSGLADERREIVVWGVGTHTLHLLETTRLAEVPIAAFVDTNANYHGKQLHGRPIISPQEMQKRSEPILVSSLAFQDEIVAFIRAELAMTNPLILLY